MELTIHFTFRYGQVISIEDALFSFEIAPPFFAHMKRDGVHVETRIAFAMALAKFYESLSPYVDAGEIGMNLY